MGSPSLAPRQVGCDLAFEVGDEGTTLVLQVAPARPTEVVDEVLDVRLDGTAQEVRELSGAHGSRSHVVRCGPGVLTVAYGCTVTPVVTDAVAGDDDLFDVEALEYLRQSRYAPSDVLAGFAAVELADLAADDHRAAAVADWVFERLAYVGGSSGPLDTAVDTLLSGAGVCRDFAHLTLGLCRALEIPARLAAVYAPGLSPMDFHAVVEARVGGMWQVLDATKLAPRPGLVRIATGRDAADTAFASNLRGEAELTLSEVRAVIEGDLPADDHRGPMRLA